MFSKRSEYQNELKQAHEELKQSLLHLKDNDDFKVFLKALDRERENFIRVAYQPKTTDQDRLMSLGAVNMVDIIAFISETESQ